MQNPLTIFWFRRDLRLQDNAGLFYALSHSENVLPIFIFDTDILKPLTDKRDKRVNFIYKTLQDLKSSLENLGSSLWILQGKPEEVFEKITAKYPIKAIYCNHDYEPYAQERDNKVEKLLKNKHISFFSYKDQVIFEKDEIVKDDGKPYTVFTPYSKKWKAKLNDFFLQAYPTEKYFQNFHKTSAIEMPSLKAIGFEVVNFHFPSAEISTRIIHEYSQKRDFPAIKGTTRLSVHLRFGTLSIRKLASIAKPLSESWLNELIWRDFYMMILYHFPHVVQKSFKPMYDKIPWKNNPDDFKRWCEGQTGYPIVDAGMRELNATGFMHNRIRMVTASFLTKHLLIDWRWGERYFAEKLLDFDLAANNGGWQWAAGSGCDAAPYFRIFNPLSQTQKFDKELTYIKKWIPELSTFNYPRPIVEHQTARLRALDTYKEALQNGSLHKEKLS